MELVTENAIFKFEENDKKLVEEVSKYLDENSAKVYEFFKIEKQEKPIINILETKAEYDDLYKEMCGVTEVPKWAVGFSSSNMQIYCVSLDDYKNTSHAFDIRDYDNQLEKYKKNVVHEYAHYINRCYCKKNNCEFTIKYLCEGLAQYLSNQKDNEVIKFEFSLEDILNSKKCYNGWYLATKYIIDNYPYEVIEELLKNRTKAKNFLENIYDNMREYYLNLEQSENIK